MPDDGAALAQTQDIEVLFGFSVRGPDENPSKTVVLSSRDKRLQNEFYYLFQALRRHSYEIALERPHLFRSGFEQSDVLGTFKPLPKERILKAIDACGSEIVSESHAKRLDAALRALIVG